MRVCVVAVIRASVRREAVGVVACWIAHSSSFVFQGDLSSIS